VRCAAARPGFGRFCLAHLHGTARKGKRRRKAEGEARVTRDLASVGWTVDVCVQVLYG
jgi:hypothetical protein